MSGISKILAQLLQMHWGTLLRLTNCTCAIKVHLVLWKLPNLWNNRSCPGGQTILRCKQLIAQCNMSMPFQPLIFLRSSSAHLSMQHATSGQGYAQTVPMYATSALATQSQQTSAPKQGLSQSFSFSQGSDSFFRLQWKVKTSSRGIKAHLHQTINDLQVHELISVSFIQYINSLK